MTELTRDDVRAAVGAGMISEAQAASLIALSDSRRGVRERMSGLDEPFELFRGFNEIFIVVGLTILYVGWTGLTGVAVLEHRHMDASGYLGSVMLAAITLGALAICALYFTIKRRMVAPSIALSTMVGLSSLQLGFGVAGLFGLESEPGVALASAIATLCLAAFYAWFRVPFATLLIALSVFGTAFALALTPDSASWYDVRDIFLLSAAGPMAYITIGLGITMLIVALMFDMSDPHRVTRRSASGFWLHVIAAPAIVNTVALTLFDKGTSGAQLAIVLFVAVMAVFAIAIDRRSFLISGVGYIVALSVVVIEDAAFLAILFLGLGLVVLGAQWEKIRRAIMTALPAFPGKDRLPPWDLISSVEQNT